ncbi:hypothetical protein F383_37807 [Gossypium arboreum]|uniref:Uncharacterized protein n=1 Tax=Gossypium arboreum TaxID=29729 RepID=A0A0B0MGI0_GOSAR|nr:hypothetical protein F383_37807 [Gossypium arboreum]
MFYHILMIIFHSTTTYLDFIISRI